MADLLLKRVFANERATFGVLIADGAPWGEPGVSVPFAVTLELPWRDNDPRVSCIPTGRYRCVRVKSPKFGWTYEVTGVPGRELIRFHWGNREDDTLGCPLVAEKFDPVRGRIGVADSREGFDEFLSVQDDCAEFWLTVVSAI